MYIIWYELKRELDMYYGFVGKCYPLILQVIDAVHYFYKLGTITIITIILKYLFILDKILWDWKDFLIKTDL